MLSLVNPQDAQQRCENIISILGYYTKDQRCKTQPDNQQTNVDLDRFELGIVFESANIGDLSNVIANPAFRLTAGAVVHWSRDLANAVAYCHEQKVIPNVESAVKLMDHSTF